MSEFLTVSIDDSYLQALIANWMVKTGKTANDAVFVMGRSACQAFMQYTLPRENKRTENKVESDIHRVYASVGMVYEDIKHRSEAAADAFWYFSSIGKWKRAKQIMEVESVKYGALPISPFDGGKLHSRLRGERGHVAKGMTPKMVVKERGQKSKLGAYIEEKRTNVGMAKAGWYEAWKALGNARGAPQWVTRKRVGKGNFGDASVVKHDTNPSVVIHNKVRHAIPSLEGRYQDWIESAVVARGADFFRRQLGIKS